MFFFSKKRLSRCFYFECGLNFLKQITWPLGEEKYKQYRIELLSKSEKYLKKLKNKFVENVLSVSTKFSLWYFLFHSFSAPGWFISSGNYESSFEMEYNIVRDFRQKNFRNFTENWRHDNLRNSSMDFRKNFSNYYTLLTSKNIKVLLKFQEKTTMKFLFLDEFSPGDIFRNFIENVYQSSTEILLEVEFELAMSEVP